MHSHLLICGNDFCWHYSSGSVRSHSTLLQYFDQRLVEKSELLLGPSMLHNLHTAIRLYGKNSKGEIC